MTLLRRTVFALLAATSLLAATGCSGADSGDATADDSALRSDGPTKNFVQVNPNLFRGARPELEPMRQLKAKYGIKTIISLELADYIEALPSTIEQERRDAESLGIRFEHRPMTSFNVFTGLGGDFDKNIDSILGIMKDPAAQPVYVHCRHGLDRTGLAVGIERVLVEGWDGGRAHDEMVKIGFRRLFLNLSKYFEAKTGWHDPEDD